MGFMDQFKQAKDAMGGGNLGKGDMGDMMEMSERYNKLAQSGIQRQAKITSLQETGRKDIGGSPEYSIALEISGEDGSTYSTTITQFLHPQNVEHFQEGREVGVKVDPDDPGNAVVWG
jgi:hypothetical protein